MPSEYPILVLLLGRCGQEFWLLTKIFTSRRLIGRRFDDPTVKKDIESWPFKVVDDAGTPKIEVEYLGEKKTFSAQEISSMVLLKVCRSVARLVTWPERERRKICCGTVG
jgi:hypothetical protein